MNVIIYTIDFWIGIVFWCMNQNCGLATHMDTFSTKEECLKETAVMEQHIKIDKNRPPIVESRCSPQKIKFTLTEPKYY